MTLPREDWRSRRHYLVGAAIAAVTMAVFGPMLGNGFLDLADNIHITNNPYIQSGLTLEGLRWAFTTFYSSLWYPLTWVSHMLDCQFFGLDPWGHHLTSLLLHATNAVLLFFLLHRMTRRLWESAFATCLFALHPLRVESVAWAAERKDVLGVFFWLLMLWAYFYYARKPSWRRYGVVAFLFALDLMSKPMVVTLPLVLLLLDFWPLNRASVGMPSAPSFSVFRLALGALKPKRIALVRLTVEKLPLFAMSAAAAVLTMSAQKPFIASVDQFPWRLRLMGCPVFYAQYLGRMFWPAHLSIYYPHPGPALAFRQSALALLFLAGVTFAAASSRQRRPYFLTGWLWFLVTFVPVIGLVQITGRAAADRFTYLPQIGISVLAAWGAGELAKRRLVSSGILGTAAGITLIACILATRRELFYWSRPTLLYARALETAPKNELIHNILGVYLARHDDVPEAERQFWEAIRLRPNYADAHNNLGFLLNRENRIPEAAAQYQEALRIDPNHVQARRNLSNMARKNSVRPHAETPNP